MKNIFHSFFLVALFFLFSCSKKMEKKEVLESTSKIDRLSELDVKLGVPEPNDWLYAHREPGQTFDTYVKDNPVRPTEKQNYIYLQPIGDFTPGQRKTLLSLCEYIGAFFYLRIKMPEDLPDNIFPIEKDRWTSDGRRQVLTTYVLDSILPFHLRDDAMLTLAITNRDLYAGDNNSYVFGQATLKKRMGVASMSRFIGEDVDSSKCLERLIKTATHETGHMLNMRHCTHAVCLMNGSNSVEELDGRPFHLCSECTKKLQWNMQFSINDRFESLKKVCTKYGMEEEADYIKKSQELIQ
jgi:archaemetzincin